MVEPFTQKKKKGVASDNDKTLFKNRFNVGHAI